MKHPKTDLSQMTPSEKKHWIMRGHLRSFHAYAASDDEALTRLNRMHDEAHRIKERA